MSRMSATPVISSPAQGTVPEVGDERPRLLSVDKTAWTLGGLSYREVLRMIDRGQLESILVGRRRMVIVESIDRYIETQRASA